jgi:hypothetical protein
MGKVYSEARRQQGQSELLDDLVSTAPAVDSRQVPQGADIADVSRERLREAVQLLEQKASPEEAEAYKRFVLQVAEAAARAHKEGGFIGIGGREVSEKEQAALEEIASILGVNPSAQPPPPASPPGS